MNNSIFRLPSITSGGYILANIFSTNIRSRINDAFITKYNYMWYYRDIQAGEKLEALAFNEYSGKSEYWDLLFVINQMDSVFSLPANNDIVIMEGEKLLTDWETKFGAQPTMIRDALRLKFIEDVYIINEKHRRFRFVDIKYISNLIELLKNV